MSMKLNLLDSSMFSCVAPQNVVPAIFIFLGNRIFSEKMVSSIEHGGMRPFFYMVDQFFGNDSLEPFECIFMAPLTL